MNTPACTPALLRSSDEHLAAAAPASQRADSRYRLACDRHPAPAASNDPSEPFPPRAVNPDADTCRSTDQAASVTRFHVSTYIPSTHPRVAKCAARGLRSAWPGVAAEPCSIVKVRPSPQQGVFPAAGRFTGLRAERRDVVRERRPIWGKRGGRRR